MLLLYRVIVTHEEKQIDQDPYKYIFFNKNFTYGVDFFVLLCQDDAHHTLSLFLYILYIKGKKIGGSLAEQYKGGS